MPAADLRWVFFDIGSTLINADRAYRDRAQQIADVLAEQGMRVTLAAVEAAISAASADYAPRPVWRALAVLTGGRIDLADVLTRIHYRKEMEEPYPAAAPLLERLAQRYRLGVVANQPAGLAQRLRQFGLFHLLSDCVCSGDVGLEKPDAAIFHLAMARAGCAPGQAMMVGDRIDNDIAPAKALGWRTLRVLQGIAQVQRPRSEAESPDLTVDRLDGVACLIQCRP